MFVKINPLLGANTDPRCRHINVMRAIRIVANSSAGATPTCNVISGPTGTQEANQMITVISNTEAGGWALESTTNTAHLTGNTYSDATAIYHIHLYNDSGKATYNYKNFVYRTNPVYGFNGGANANTQVYPMHAIYYGVSNSNMYGAGNFTGFNLGNTASHNVTMLLDPNNTWSQYTNATIATANATNVWPLSYFHGEFYMAATSDYLIFFQTNTYVIYCGTRYTNSWEDAYTDNPPAVGFIQQNFNYPQAHWMWTRYQNYSNNAVAGPIALVNKIVDFGGAVGGTTYTNTTYHAYHTISGLSRQLTSTATGVTYGGGYAHRVYNYSTGSPTLYQFPHMLYYSGIHNYQYGQTTSSSLALYAPVKDSNTSTFVPPAVPIVSGFYGDFFNSGGRVKGMFKSLSGPYSYISQYMTIDQDFSVANDTGGYDTYRAVMLSRGTTVGNNDPRDIFLIRNA